MKTTAAKKVAKKDVVAEAPVAAAPAPAPVKEAKAKKAAVAPAPVAAPVVAPVAAAPEASAVEAAAGPTTTLQQDIDSLIAQTVALRDSASSMLKALQRLNKRSAREMREAGRRRRRQRKTEGTEGSETAKRPTIFKTPVTLKNELCSFLGKPAGTQMAPADVTKAFSAYVNAHGLKNAEKGQGHTIHPDAAMRKLFGLREGETVSYRNVQKSLYDLYILPKKASATTASA